MNDTSLAAATVSDRHGTYRHIFFQDFNSSLGHSVFDQSASSWADEADFILTDSALRSHTPLAAIYLNTTDFHVIQVFFVNTDNLLTATWFYLTNDPGGPSYNPIPMNESLAVATGTRSLTVNLMPLTQTNESIYAEAIVLYEAPSGNITVLRGYFSNANSNDTGWLWQNISDAVYSHFRGTSTWLSAPIGSACTIQTFFVCWFTFFNAGIFSDVTASPLSVVQFQNWTNLCEFSHYVLLMLKSTYVPYQKTTY